MISVFGAENLSLALRAVAQGASFILNAAPARPLNPNDWAGLLTVLIVNETEAALISG
jgi:sugar/nucleoside kinase (ribokinase family)